MAHQYLFKLIPLALAAALVACGGGGDDGGSAPAPQPPIIQAPFKMEVLGGRTEVDFTQCQWLDTPTLLKQAQFNHLQRVGVYADAMYLIDSGENCWGSPPVIGSQSLRHPKGVSPSVYRINDEYVSFHMPLWSVEEGVFPLARPISPVFINSLYHKANEEPFVILSYGAAPSETGFALNDTLLTHFASQNLWKKFSFALGVFKFYGSSSAEHGLVAGTPGQPPGYADGKGREARFTAPHDLEGDADGLLYLIDAGRIRTVDQKDWQVRTLDNPSLGASGVFKTLDSDRMGRVHAIEQIDSGRYVWHRLADKRRVAFTLPNPPAGKTVETFAVIGDELLMAVRGMTAEAGKNASTVYRVNASGQTLRVSGQAQPAQADDWLNDPQKFAWPQVQHLEYGSDGHLYVALPQGVLRARDFK